MYQPHTHVTVFAGLAGPDLGLRFGVDLAFCIRPVQLYTTRVPLRDVRHVSSPCATTTTTTFPPPRGVACVTIIGRTYGPTAVAGVCGVVRLRLTVYPTGGFVYPWVGYVNRKKVSYVCGRGTTAWLTGVDMCVGRCAAAHPSPAQFPVTSYRGRRPIDPRGN